MHLYGQETLNKTVYLSINLATLYLRKASCVEVDTWDAVAVYLLPDNEQDALNFERLDHAGSENGNFACDPELQTSKKIHIKNTVAESQAVRKRKFFGHDRCFLIYTAHPRLLGFGRSTAIGYNVTPA